MVVQVFYFANMVILLVVDDYLQIADDFAISGGTSAGDVAFEKKIPPQWGTAD